MAGERCQYCGTMDDRIHGLQCPVMQAYHCLQLARWAVHVEKLLAESLATSLNPKGHDHEMHVAKQLDLIGRWRVDFQFTDIPGA